MIFKFLTIFLIFNITIETYGKVCNEEWTSLILCCKDKLFNVPQLLEVNNVHQQCAIKYNKKFKSSKKRECGVDYYKSACGWKSYNFVCFNLIFF